MTPRAQASQVISGRRVVPAPTVRSMAPRHQRALLRAWLVATDAAALLVAFALAYWVRFDLQVSAAPEVVPHPTFYPALAAVLTPGWLLLFAAFNLYEARTRLGGIVESSRLFSACSAAMLLVIVATFVVPTFDVARMWLLAAWLFSFLLVAGNRFLNRRVVYSLRHHGYLLTNGIIVGTNEEANALAHQLIDWRASGVRFVGCVTTGAGTAPDWRHQLPVLGSVTDADAVVREHGIEDIIVAITSVSRDELLRLYEDVNPLDQVELRISSGLYEILTTSVAVRALGTVPLLSLGKVRLEREEALLKGLLDVSVAAAGVLVLSPVLLAIAVLVRLDSPGPVLHRRRVLGVGGRPFDAFKFRTMRVDGDTILETDEAAQLRANHKLKDDPRVTRVGRWLRRFSLDELPQLLNVLRGQMSLVGPRMIAPEEADMYGRHKMNLLTVKPGITGLWQVSGRSDLSYDERVRLDMYYIRNYSIWLDLQILLVETLPAVLRGRGAY